MVAIWTIGVLYCFLFGQPQVRPVKSQAASGQYQQQTPQAALAEANNASATREHAQNDQSYAKKWLDPMVLLTILLVIGVGVTASIYYGQLKKMKETLALVGQQARTMHSQFELTGLGLTQQLSADNRQMKFEELQGEVMVGQLKAMREQAEFAKGQLVAMQHQAQAQFKSLEAMQEQAKTMDRSLVLGTRAYLGVHSLDFDVENKRIFLHIENIGRVPAKDIQVVVEINVEVPNTKYEALCRSRQRYDWTEKDGERHLQIPFWFPYGRTKLFPGSLKIPVMVRLDDSPHVSDEQFVLISGGHAKLKVQGVIIYSDGFHSGKKTEFAFRYFAKNKKSPWVPQPVEGLKFQVDREKPNSDYEPS